MFSHLGLCSEPSGSYRVIDAIIQPCVTANIKEYTVVVHIIVVSMRIKLPVNYLQSDDITLVFDQ